MKPAALGQTYMALSEVPHRCNNSRNRCPVVDYPAGAAASRAGSVRHGPDRAFLSVNSVNSFAVAIPPIFIESQEYLLVPNTYCMAISRYHGDGSAK